MTKNKKQVVFNPNMLLEIEWDDNLGYQSAQADPRSIYSLYHNLKKAGAKRINVNDVSGEFKDRKVTLQCLRSLMLQSNKYYIEENTAIKYDVR